MMRFQYLLVTLLCCLQLSVSTDITLTFIYDKTSYLSCEKENSDSSSVWLKDGVAIDITSDPNLGISATGTLIFHKFGFSDAGTYHCQDTSITYILIIDCPRNSDPNFLSDKCICSSGATSNTSSSSLDCYLCPLGQYKPHPGNHECFPCTTSLVTEKEGSISETSCVCIPGYGISNSLCVPCPTDSYQSEYEETACIPCPLYSETPQPPGEADAEAFTSKSDCVCLYSPDNAENATCWPFATQPTVSLVGTTDSSATVAWVTQLYARADNGAYRGIVAGYHMEVREDNELKTNVFTQNFTPGTYTPGEILNVEISGLRPLTNYNVMVNAYTKSTSFEDGPPFGLCIKTVASPTPTTTTTAAAATPTTTISTSGTNGGTTRTSESTAAIATTAATTTTTTTPRLPPTTTTTIATTEEEKTPLPSVVVVKSDSTASSILAVLVVLMFLCLVGLFLFLAVRYWRRSGKRSQRYARAGEGERHVGPRPQYGIYGNAIFSNSETGDSYI